jgi:predicted MFS family arabinose efflux permease
MGKFCGFEPSNLIEVICGQNHADTEDWKQKTLRLAMSFKDRLLWRLFKIDLARADDRNAWYLVVELFWATILSAVASFNAAFAIRLGADNFQVGLLSSIPALLAVLVSIPAGRFLTRKSCRKPWVVGSLFIHRTGYLLVAVSPWFHLFNIEPGLLVVLIIGTISAPAHFFNVGWTAMLADVIPEQRRAAVFTARNIVGQATICVAVFLCGQWLSRVHFPINYQVLYFVGYLASLVSIYYLSRLNVPDRLWRHFRWKSRNKASLAGRARSMAKRFTDHPGFLRITVNTFLHGMGLWMAGPLYSLYFVRELGASDAWLGLNGTLGSLGNIIGYSFWRWQMARWGEHNTLKRTIVLAGVYAVLVGLTPSLPVILLYGILNGLFVSPGINLSHFNTLLKVTPAEARPQYVSIYQTIMNIGAFIAPLVSVAIASQIGLPATLVGCGLLSIIGSSSFIWDPIPEQREESPVLLES